MSHNIDIWGPNVWFFLHGLAEKIKEDKFNECKSNLIELIKLICFNLPCPECSKDAENLLKKTNINAINKKEDLKKYIFNFHNHINKKLNKNIFLYENLDSKYCNINIYKTFNNIIHIYSLNSNNPKLMQYSIIRRRSIIKLNNYFNSIKPFLIN